MDMGIITRKAVAALLREIYLSQLMLIEGSVQTVNMWIYCFACTKYM